MSNEPQNRIDSGELAAKVGSRLWKVVAAVLTVLVIVAPPTIYVIRLPTKSEVQLTVRSGAPTRKEFSKLKEDFTKLKVKAKAWSEGTSARMNRLESMLLKRLDRIERKLDDMHIYRPRHRRRKQ